MGYLYNLANVSSQGSGISGEEKAERVLESAVVNNYKEMVSPGLSMAAAYMKLQFYGSYHKASAMLRQTKS